MEICERFRSIAFREEEMIGIGASDRDDCLRKSKLIVLNTEFDKGGELLMVWIMQLDLRWIESAMSNMLKALPKDCRLSESGGMDQGGLLV